MAEGFLWYAGIPFPTKFCKTEDIRAAHEQFVVKDKDIITVTYPRSGTNWMIEILCLILSKGDPEWIRSVPMWERCLSIESELGSKIIRDMKEGPRLLTSHLPFQLFPKSFLTSKAKVIYVLRNPKDVLVSRYYFICQSKFMKNPESLQQYDEWFIQGNVAYGSWFAHVLGWMSMRESKSVLVLSYEALKKDTRSTVEKICQFLGKKLEPEELDLVVENSSFQAMKENKMSNYSSMDRNYISANVEMIRKGMVGDWKNHLTVAQAEAFDKIFQEKMAGFPPELLPCD
ncbi:sulfotransferase 2A1-like [Perognathus longimembris pacificus]|uniref:sulfotransferase 2A1-like n=1 Tax=Perognathus longimembris pacificus TaxID=214514 RepID=UPI0020185BDF|nr:sulfotransferase 2A1-like [Perognathus longimembris pacificus]XP_048225360.1 sulfotransferase 2A1-like [Perognathus longimembris pacificus]